MREALGGFVAVLGVLVLVVLAPLVVVRSRLAPWLRRLQPRGVRREIVVMLVAVCLLLVTPDILVGCAGPASDGAGGITANGPPQAQSTTRSPNHTKSATPKATKTESATGKAATSTATAATTGRPSVRIVFVNVGQGDAEIIRAGSFDCLIDGGPSGEGAHLESELRKAGVRRLDLLIVTHPHADHIGDLAGVIADYRPARALVDEGATTSTYAGVRNALRAAGTRMVHEFRGTTLRMGPLTARVVSPGSLSGDANADSVVLLLDVYGKRFLFSGDCAGANESAVGAIVARGPPLYLLKVAHHGSAYSTSSSFLSEVRPRFAVIEVGSNAYGHPAASTIKRLKTQGARIYSTQKNGDISLTIAASGAVTWRFSGSAKPVTRGVSGTDSSTSSGSSGAGSTVSGGASRATIVYTTETGECYHRDGCRYLSHSRIPITLKEARARGYRPCSVCRPPQ
jgi:competence protein ComEC